MPAPTNTPAGTGGASSTPPVQVVHDTDYPEQYDAADDASLGDNWQAEMAREISGGKAATVKANARANGADPDEALELSGETDEGDEPIETAETETDETAADDKPVWNREAGRWMKNGKFVAGTAPEGDAAIEAGADDTAADTGEGGEGEGGAAAALPEGVAIYDAEGDEVDIPEGVVIGFKGLDGKPYKKDLNGLVELAQRGVYNHGLQQQAQRARELEPQVKELRGALSEYQSRDEQYDKYLQRLMTDDDFFVAEQQAFQEENTPEARAERAEAEVERLKSETRMDAEHRVADEKLKSDVWPAFGKIQEQFTGVTPAELIQQFGTLTSHLKVNGRVPSAKLAEVASIVRSELAPWAAQLHEARTAGRRPAAPPARRTAPPTRVAAEATPEQQRQAAENKRLRKIAARAIAPTSGAGAPGARPAAGGGGPRRPPKTAQEGANRALETALASVGA